MDGKDGRTAAAEDSRSKIYAAMSFSLLLISAIASLYRI